MRFDWSLNVGTILTILTLIVTAFSVVQAVKNRLQLFEAALQSHSESLKKHDMLFGTYETRIFDLVGSLQRLIGRFETLEHSASKGKQ